MEPTKLLYLEDFTCLECDAKVFEVTRENERDVVVLDQTVFYPQGGGQPYDTGVIAPARQSSSDGGSEATQSQPAKFAVHKVRFVDGAIKHIGAFEAGGFTAGDVVHCTVDADRRSLMSRLHSAGHVVDMAMAELKPDWVPGKGYHFPDGPYVEYHGSLEGVDKEKFKAELEAACNKFVAEDRATKLVFMDKSKMHDVCRFVPDYVPTNKPGRVVIYLHTLGGVGVNGSFGVPCGGTHVSRLSEIRLMTIRKLKQEGANVRVGYDVAR